MSAELLFRLADATERGRSVVEVLRGNGYANAAATLQGGQDWAAAIGQTQLPGLAVPALASGDAAAIRRLATMLEGQQTAQKQFVGTLRMAAVALAVLMVVLAVCGGKVVPNLVASLGPEAQLSGLHRWGIAFSGALGSGWGLGLALLLCGVWASAAAKVWRRTRSGRRWHDALALSGLADSLRAGRPAADALRGAAELSNRPQLLVAAQRAEAGTSLSDALAGPLIDTQWQPLLELASAQALPNLLDAFGKVRFAEAQADPSETPFWGGAFTG